MAPLRALFFGLLCLHAGVSAELSPGACSLLRTATSITTIAPEVVQLAMRYYRVSSPSPVHHRQKRFLFAVSPPRDDSGSSRGSVLEQMVASAFKDVNYTKVAQLILHNDESLNRIRQNVDGEAIFRAAMRNVDYEKLGRSLWHAAEDEFDLEHLVSTFMNVTRFDTIHNEVTSTGVLPHWLVRRIHPDLDVHTVDRTVEILKNLSRKFLTIMNSSESLDQYLFETIQQHALTPLQDIIRRVTAEKPTTLDRLVEIILNNVNKIVTDQFSTVNGSTSAEKDEPTTNATPVVVVEEAPAAEDDMKLLFYQSAIIVDSIGHSARIALKAIEKLYCTTVWE